MLRYKKLTADHISLRS